MIDKLNQIGLTKREAEVYLALLQKKDFTAPELAKVTTITRTKIYEILQSLVHKGACNESYKNGQKVFRGINPKIAIQNVISNYEHETEQRKKNEIEQKKKTAALIETELVLTYEGGINSSEPIDYIEVLTDPGQIRERWLSIQNNTKHEMLVFVKPPYTGALDDNVNEEQKLLSSITGKGIYEYKNITTPEEKNTLVKILETYQRIGEEVKVVKELPMKLVISDETIAMFALNDKISLKPSITTMIVDHPSFASALKRIFESIWNDALSIEDFKNLEKI